jgi:hypothetical protein
MVLPSLTSRITTNRTAAFCLSLGFLTLYFLTISGSLTTRSFDLIKRPTRVNLTQLLTAVPSSQQGASWTDEDGVEAPFAVIGSPILTITFDTSEIIDVVTGEQLAGELDGGLFNLAVIKLPVGSEWDFLGVARGPTRKWSFLEVSGKGAKEQVLVA